MNNNIENFRKWMLNNNMSKLTSVTSADGYLKFISEVSPEKLKLPAGWGIRKKFNTFEFFNSEDSMVFEVRQVHRSKILNQPIISW